MRKNCLYRGITHNQQPMNAPSSETEIFRAPEPRVKRAPNYKLLWPLALGRQQFDSKAEAVVS